jgi:two-component system LytT family sensor kinase
MLQMKVRLNDIWLRIIGIPLFALTADVIANYEEILINGNVSGYTFYYFLLLILLGSLIWQTNRFIHLKVRKYYEQFHSKDKMVKGFIIRLLLYGTSTIILIFIVALVFDHTAKNFEHSPGQAFFQQILFFQFLQPISFALLSSYLIAGYYETRYFIYEWGRSFTEAEDLKKLNLQIQVDSLKNQINPHFLFNSLNTLSSLVSSDRANAEKFIDEMSTIYRYLLQNNEKNLITLKDELHFIHSFFHLLKTRYAEAIKINIDVKDLYTEYLVPPLSLQVLVENAVKHNVVSVAKPLEIKIYTDELQQLIIENNVQHKVTAVKSNKVGLTNIFAKYNLLNQPQVIVNHTEKIFQVILPLISPESKETEANSIVMK